LSIEQGFSAVGQPIMDDAKAQQPGLGRREGWATPLLSVGNGVAPERLFLVSWSGAGRAFAMSRILSG
jgi:hypothetical protein